MCKQCHEFVVKEMDIRMSDLEHLPYTWCKWRCIVPNCRGGCRVKDYQNAPYFFDPAKPRENIERNSWRGGWFDASEHFYICSRHAKDWEKIVEMMKHRFNASFFLLKIVSLTTTKKKKKNVFLF